MEVLCSGLNVVDLLVSTPEHIRSGQKNECEKILVQGGAPAGNAACGLASLGHETGFIGYFGENTLSQIASHELLRHGVSDRYFHSKPSANPAIAIVQINASGERTVLYSMNGYSPFAIADLDETIFHDCKLLLVDGYDVEINTYLLERAKALNIPSILDIEKAELTVMTKMIRLASHAILPLDSCQFFTNEREPEKCLMKAASLTSAQLVITDGANGSWAMDKEKIIHQPSFKVDVIDTTGCGDSFHAAYGSALIQGMALNERLAYASFYASQVARHFGGRTHLPDRSFMDENFKKTELSRS